MATAAAARDERLDARVNEEAKRVFVEALLNPSEPTRRRLRQRGD
jgi:hypothetical protein